MIHRYIRGVGLELEGGWMGDEPPTPIHEDGSVFEGDHEMATYVGEVSSPILHSPGEIERFLVTNYPDVVDGTCGLHVHMSFPRLGQYVKLMDYPFREFFRARMTELIPKLKGVDQRRFMNRLGGGNTYCKDDWYPDAQLNRDDRHHLRYTQVNFCHRLHGTVEFRLFPMFERSVVAVRAIDHLLTNVDAWLALSRGRVKLEQELDFTEEPDEQPQTEIICV